MADAQPLKLVGFPYKSSKNRQKWNFTKSKIGADWTVNLNLLITNVKKSFENSHPVADTEPLKLVRFPHKPSKNHQKWNFTKSKIAADSKVLLEALIMNPKRFSQNTHPASHTFGFKRGGAILYTKKCKKDVSFYQKMQKRVFVWPINAEKMFLLTKKCQKDAPFSKIGERDASFTKKA